jgi:WD40 repeat protein
MEGGRSWWLQITEALSQVEFMALVVTPGSVDSPIVRKEYRFARQEGVCIYPVVGAARFAFSSLPHWLRKIHIYELHHEREWLKFLSDLRSPCRVPRVPFMAHDLPSDFVVRQEEMNALTDFLRKPERDAPVAITASLTGAGGFGKTTLATALCHDERVLEAFDDGVLWVTLGESPGDLTRHVEDLIYILQGERPAFSDLQPAVTRLAELLDDRDLLMVIDDVWDSAHLKPFLQGGRRCARLITTRLLDVLPRAVKRVDVDAMRQFEAVALVGFDLPPGREEELRRLADRLGEWPLLLTLVNGVLRSRVLDSGQAFVDALSAVDEDLSVNGLTAFDARNALDRNQAVEKTIGISLARLTPDERERFRELSIFPEDVDIPLTFIERLWRQTGSLERLDTENFGLRLSRLSLLQVFDLEARRLRLHDVIRNFLSRSPGPELATIHRLFLAAHRPTSSWGDMPAAEPYLWNWLAYHLLAAGLPEELRSTVQDPWYLAVKTWLHGGFATEVDLRKALQFADGRSLRRLEQAFVLSRHLFESHETFKGLAATLHSRLLHLPDLDAPLQRLADRLEPPYLLARHAVPDIPQEGLRRTLTGTGSPLNACAVSADGRIIVAVSTDGTLLIWDMATQTLRLTLRHHAELNCCAIRADGALVVAGSRDGTLKAWDTRSGDDLHTLEGHTGPVNACAFFLPDTPFIVSASEDETIRIWSLESAQEILALIGHQGPVTGCAVHPTSGLILSTSSDRTLMAWSRLDRVPATTTLPSAFGGNCCAFSPDGRYAACSFGNCVLVIDSQEGRSFTVQSSGTLVTGCAVRQDGFVAASSFAGLLEVWPPAEGHEAITFAEHTDRVTGCVVDPTDLSIVSCSGDGTVRIWDVGDTLAGSGTSRRVWHEGAVSACAVSPDGNLLATTSGSKVILSRLEDQRPVRDLEGHTGDVTDCSFSPDGSSIVSASMDGTLRIWTVADGCERLVLAGHETSVHACCFSPDGRSVVSGAGDYTHTP